jgi:hypothetical protein
MSGGLRIDEGPVSIRLRTQPACCQLHPGEVDVFLTRVTQVMELQHERLILLEQNRMAKWASSR